MNTSRVLQHELADFELGHARYAGDERPTLREILVEHGL
jgi:hypothetical protein